MSPYIVRTKGWHIAENFVLLCLICI
jgi:hypothetical protein